MKKIINICLVFIFITACSSLPGGKEITDADINAQAEKSYIEVKSKSKMSTNKEWIDMVQRVAKRIEIASGEPFKWEAVLIESPELNAWCMPGGKMAVYTGILPVLQNEGALAAVMGHEVAHATLRHGKQQYARAMKGSFIGTAVGAVSVLGGQLLCKTSTCKNLSLLGGVAAGFAVTFFDRKFSREDETSADKEGQLLMAKAGYDPSEAPKLWQRMNLAMGGKAPPEWLSTHPSDDRRRENLNVWMESAQAAYNKSPKKYGIGETVKK